MREEEVAYIRASGDFRTPNEIAELYGGEVSVWLRRLQKWKDDGAIFSIEDQGIERFPIYALDPGNSNGLNKALLKVLNIFGQSLSDWGIASWFAGLNSYLDDQYPKDLLALDPDWVVKAAHDAVNEIQ